MLNPAIDHKPLSGLYTDLYQLSMSQVYFLKGHAKSHTVFDYFFRKVPYEGGFVVFSGLSDLLSILENLRFSDDDIDYLSATGFDNAFLKYLKEFRFRGTIYSSKEGDVVFPTRPILRVEAGMIEAQLVETVILNILNFQSLIATKASRVRLVAPDKILSDFGLRRAQGFGAYHATRAAMVGGFDSTSNVLAARDYQVPAVGTMAHSFIQSYDDELTAFRHFAEGRPHQCILLVDTYDTLQSGIPNAITVAKEMQARGQQLYGIRLDSGDLAYLSKRARKMLDEAGLHDVKIAASNQLDEHVVKSLLEQGAPIDIFGVGTAMVTGQPDAALDGVYKLAYSEGKPRIKLSETLKKTTLPDRKQVFRVYDKNGSFYGADAIGLCDESRVNVMHHPFEPDNFLLLKEFEQEPLLQKVMEDGKALPVEENVNKISAYSMERIKLLPDEYKRFQFPHVYKVGISEPLKQLRDDLRNQYKK